jgi:cytochrome c-type protein NapB
VNRRRRPDPGTLARRIGGIAVALFVMIPVVLLLLPDAEAVPDFRAVSIVRAQESGPPIPAEMGPFMDLKDGLYPVSMGGASPHVVVPTRMERRVRRAYEGAPPWIPHQVPADMERTQDCAPCHTFGGYNPPLRTYSPRAPHLEFTNCLQCHVAQVQTDLYRPTDWETPPWPEYGQERELMGAPPRIPHTLQLRERCLTCHGGASAAPDIRTPHPERFNCRQCHLPTVDDSEAFSRPLNGGDRP